MKLFAVILTAAAMSFAFAADDSSPFVGTWKLDAQKSKFKPGPGPTSETVTIGADGKVAVDETMSDGHTQAWSYTYMENQTVPITGMENSSVLEKRPDSRHVEHTWTFNRGTMHGKGVVSKDGKTMHYTMTGTTASGKREDDDMVFEKQ